MNQRFTLLVALLLLLLNPCRSHGQVLGSLWPFGKERTAEAGVIPPAPSTQPEATPTPKPGILKRALGTVGIGRDKAAGANGLLLTVKSSPEIVKLSNSLRLEVKVTLSNTTEKLVNLRFPSGQRIEIQLVAPDGKVVTRWSEDRAFSQEFGQISLNPGERIEYNEGISLRDAVAGKTYKLEVFFVDHPGLAWSGQITPEK